MRRNLAHSLFGKAKDESPLRSARVRGAMEDDVSSVRRLPPPPLQPQVMYPVRERIIGALFYALASVLIQITNKWVLYTYQFPSVLCLALAQFVFTVVSLRLAKAIGWIEFPGVSRDGLRAVFPLPLLFAGNAVSGLWGTKALSIPMFTVLRRSNMLFTMILEYLLLGYVFTTPLKASVAFIMVGSILAVMLDVQFDFAGYAATLLNNVFTSTSGVLIKSKLNKFTAAPFASAAATAVSPTTSESAVAKNALSNIWGLMYFNALCGVPLLLLVLQLGFPHDLKAAWNFIGWTDPAFVFMFLISSGMGTVLQWSIIYCTKVNSALTTVITGVLKNVVTSYIGMIDPRLGYSFNWANFIGVNISLAGGVLYAYIQFSEATKPALSKLPSTLSVNDSTKSTPNSDGPVDEEEQRELLVDREETTKE